LEWKLRTGYIDAHADGPEKSPSALIRRTKSEFSTSCKSLSNPASLEFRDPIAINHSATAAPIPSMG